MGAFCLGTRPKESVGKPAVQGRNPIVRQQGVDRWRPRSEGSHPGLRTLRPPHPSPKPADERKRERSGQPQGRSLSGQPGGQIQAGGEDHPPPTAQAHHPDCRPEGFNGRSGVEPLSEVGPVDREPRRISHPMQSKRDGAGKFQESEEPGSGGELVDHVSACSGSPRPVYSQAGERCRDSQWLFNW